MAETRNTEGTPLLVVILGDSPRMPTGLGRIAGDLAYRLHARREALGIDVVQLGWEYDAAGAHLDPLPWPFSPFPTIGQDWGAGTVLPAIERLRQQHGYAPAQVVLFTVWDPARCFEYRHVEYQTWGYFAVDGHNPQGTFGGPAAETVRRYDRPLGYTGYGAGVLRTLRDGPVEWLPHGHTWGQHEYAAAHAAAEPPRHGWRLGCVASNTPRKDLGLFFATLKELRAGGEKVYGWLHTDELVTGAWSIPELVDVYSIDKAWLTISTPPADDAWLAAMYASCAATLAVGRGEGHGYPIVESLAMGRAVVHGDYAGGAEWTPVAGRVVPEHMDYTNPYVVGRPLLHVGTVAGRCEQLAHAARHDATLGPFYAGTVAHLHWAQLWPRWETWVRQGLEQIRTAL